MKEAVGTLSAILLLLLFSVFSPASAVRNGKAYLYDSNMHGRKLPSGEVFRHDRLTAAHNFIPSGTIVRVTNQVNQKHIDVLVNDRWTGNPDSILITQSAAQAIGLKDGDGVNFHPIAHPISSGQPIISLPQPVSTAVVPATKQATPGLYFLEFASYKTGLQGKQLANKLTKKGAPCVVVKDQSGLHHVISDGYFTSLEDASEAYHLVSKNVGYVPVIKKL